MPNQFTGGKGPVTGEEEEFDIIFNTPFVLGLSASVLKIERWATRPETRASSPAKAIGLRVDVRRGETIMSFRSTILCIAGLILLSEPAIAAPIPVASCNASFTLCNIPENTQLMLPFDAIAGDVVLIDPGSSTVSDVFRIFNDVANTGEGTGLGDLVFLYSSDDTSLPNPSTYSANVIFIPENPSGVTSFTGNGTTYVLATPEPSTFELFALAAAMAVLTCRRSRPFKGDLRCDRHS